MCDYKSVWIFIQGDLLAKHLSSYAESDELNPSSHENLLQFAENYAAVQDYHNAKVLLTLVILIEVVPQIRVVPGKSEKN